jgi:tetratricopeptide (TPR) repeat protein
MNALENETSVDAVQAAIHYSHYLYWDVPSTEVLDKAIGLIRKHPLSELASLLPHCLLRLGALCRRMDEFPRAVVNLNQAKEEFELLGDMGRAAECCLELASVYIMLAKYPEAINVLDTARGHFKAIDDRRGISDYLAMLGRVYHRQGDFTNASAVLIESQAICATLRDHACVAVRAQVLGIIYRTEGKLDEAIKALDEADAYFTTAFIAPYYVAENIYNHGIVYYMQRHYDQSDDALTRAYGDFTLLGNHGMMAWCLFHQGELNLRRGRLENARELFGMAKSKFERMRWVQAVIDCLLGEARVFAALHQVDNVSKSCSEALTIIGDQKGYENSILEIEELLHNSETKDNA